MAGRDCALKQKGISKKKKSVILYHDHFLQVLYYLLLGYEKKTTSTGRCTITASLAVMVENTL